MSRKGAILRNLDVTSQNRILQETENFWTFTKTDGVNMIIETETHSNDFSRYLRKRQSETKLITTLRGRQNCEPIAGFHCRILKIKVKNPRHKRRWIFEQSSKDSGLCDVSCGRYLKNKALCGDIMFVSLWGDEINMAAGT